MSQQKSTDRISVEVDLAELETTKAEATTILPGIMRQLLVGLMLMNFRTGFIQKSFSMRSPMKCQYSNVRAFSNTLTKIHELKPDIGVLMVTHCRSIPIISKVVEIDKSSKHLIDGGSYHCNACFGMVSKEGYYE